MQHEVWEDGTSRGIRIAGWQVETRKQAILNASETDEASARLDIPLPEITFGNNLISLTYNHAASSSKGKQRAQEAADNGEQHTGSSSTFSLTFNGLDALAQVDTSGQDTIKVAYADKWAKSRNLEAQDGEGGTTVIETVKDYDWTYSNSYSGSLQGDLRFDRPPAGHAGIPLAKLAKQDEPILFYDEVPLYEDELHDNGVANLSIRIRVMPSCFFLLSRFFLRVDNVLFRVFDVRLYHDFSSSEIIRETRGREAPYSVVRSRLPREKADDLSPLTDHNWVANILGLLEQTQPSTSSPGAATKAPAFHGQTSVAAPWANSARRHVADGISMPLRMPAVLSPTPRGLSANVSPNPGVMMTEIASEVDHSKHSAKRRWPGLGTCVQVATF